jgi:hypothetical protein
VFSQISECTYNLQVRRTTILFLLSVSAACAQTDNAQQNPPVKVNVLNVCTPTADQQQEITSALSRLPKFPSFDVDYEIARGVSTLQNAGTARYIRLRRDFKPDSSLSTVQYSLSADSQNTAETIVFRGRNVKDLLLLSIEDKLSTAVSKPAAIVESDTPASRVSIERFGKTTVTLSRCQGVDQSAYEPIFKEASAQFAEYRRALKLRNTLASDLHWLRDESAKATASREDGAGGPISAH